MSGKTLTLVQSVLSQDRWLESQWLENELSEKKWPENGLKIDWPEKDSLITMHLEGKGLVGASTHRSYGQPPPDVCSNRDCCCLGEWSQSQNARQERLPRVCPTPATYHGPERLC